MRAPRDLPPSTLVRLICTSKSPAEAGKLLDNLIRRLRGYCKRHISREFGERLAQEIASRVERGVLEDIANGKTQHLEARFWRVVNHKIIDAARTAKSQQGARARYEQAAKGTWVAELALAERETTDSLDVQAAIRSLPPRALHALIIHYSVGLEISSKDSSLTTVSALLRCSDKSARRLLKSAEEELRARLGKK